MITIDDDLNRLEDGIRRLKIEYEIYFNGGSPRPPNDTQWRVENTLKKLGDGVHLTFAQRFRYNNLTQRYALFSELWRQKVRNREEGPRRTAADLRAEKERLKSSSFRIDWRDPAAEPEKVDKLFEAFLQAKKKCGENTDNLASESFKKFVQKKTEQLKHDFSCEQVEYVVEVEQGQVKLKAKGLKAGGR